MSKDQQMFSSSTANTLMSPFQQYYFPSSSPYYQPFQPLPQPQPPLPPPPPPPPAIPSLILNPSDNIFLHQSHQYNHLFSLANAQIPENSLINLGVISNTTTTTMPNIMTSTSTTSSTKQDLIINCGGSRHSAPNFIRKKPGAAVSKKDRHSKISTAQGLRDRRVRLSIDIAREFFDLHDMLGFDKASKTLEWLLTKSKKAIKEVSRNKLRTSTAAKSSTTLSSTGAANSDHCEQAMSEMNELVAAAADHDINLPTEEEEEEEEDHNSLLVSKQKLIDAERLSEAASMNLLAKESRAKARAKEKRHNNYCTTTTSTTAYPNNSHKIRPSNYDNNKEKFSSRGGSSSHQISNHQLLIRSVLLNQLDHHPDIDHGQIQRLTPNSVEEKGLLFRMQANHDHDQDDYDEEEPVLMIEKKLYDHCDDHEDGQFCGISSKGGASNNVVYSSSPSILLTQNWDNNNRIGTASPHPAASFCLRT